MSNELPVRERYASAMAVRLANGNGQSRCESWMSDSDLTAKELVLHRDDALPFANVKEALGNAD